MKTIVSLFGIAILLCSCQMSFNSVRGSGNKITQSRDVSGFTSVEAAGPMDVEIKMGSGYKVSVEADDNLMQYILVRKEGGKLVVKLKDNINVSYDNGMKVSIEMPSLHEVDLSGSGSLKTIGQVTDPNKIEVSISGSGNATMDVNTPSLDASISGSGKATVTGQTKTIDVSIAGSGDFEAPDLKSETAKVSIAGSGNARIFASVSIDASIVGSGDVIYSGSPSISKSIIGSGELKQAQ